MKVSERHSVTFSSEVNNWKYKTFNWI